MRKILFLIMVTLVLLAMVSCENTLEDTLYNKKTERLDETTELTEELTGELSGDTITSQKEDGARWNRVSFGNARWTR